MTDETSPGGSRIYRHQPAESPDGEVAHADDAAIAAHIEESVGGETLVFHEIVSDRVHIDVHVAMPTEDRPFHVLVTSGMSARPMTMPAGFEEPEDWCRAELSLLLPGDWPLHQEALKDERNYWPIRLIKTLARLPHDFGTWLGQGHTIPNGDPPAPYADGTALCGAIILPPFVLGEDFFELSTPDGLLHFFSVVPLTAAEMSFKLSDGTDALLDRLDAIEFEAFGPITPARASVV